MSKDMDEGVKVGTKEQTYGQLCKYMDEQWVKLRSKEGTDKKPKHTNKWKFKEKYITICRSTCDRTQNFISNHENVVL